MTSPPTCDHCARFRGPEDAHEYSPMQVITGQPLGWYSGDDGEMCGQCMAQILRNQ